MGKTGETLKFISFDDLNLIHELIMDRFGGTVSGNRSKNLINPGSLHYVLEEIQGSVFGIDRFPSIEEKAAILMFRIIAEHVFLDGNKRTGMIACIVFLALNGYALYNFDFVEISLSMRAAT